MSDVAHERDPAFPVEYTEPRMILGKVRDAKIKHLGMSLRDYIAAQVLPAFIDKDDPDPELAAGWAVLHADALIKELRK